MNSVDSWLSGYRKREYRERIRVLLYRERERRIVVPVLKRLINEINLTDGKTK
jgi:hypothetical protein